MMVAIIIFTLVVNRLICKWSCLVLFDGKLRKTEKRVVPENVFENITLIYILRKTALYHTKHKKFIFIDIILFNISMLASLFYSLSILYGKHEAIFGFIWGIILYVNICLRVVHGSYLDLSVYNHKNKISDFLHFILRVLMIILFPVGIILYACSN